MIRTYNYRACREKKEDKTYRYVCVCQSNYHLSKILGYLKKNIKII